MLEFRKHKTFGGSNSYYGNADWEELADNLKIFYEQIKGLDAEKLAKLCKAT
jgi:hypothetical protein